MGNGGGRRKSATRGLGSGVALLVGAALMWMGLVLLLCVGRLAWGFSTILLDTLKTAL
jgi:hypothetical protein